MTTTPAPITDEHRQKAEALVSAWARDGIDGVRAYELARDIAQALADAEAQGRIDGANAKFPDLNARIAELKAERDALKVERDRLMKERDLYAQRWADEAERADKAQGGYPWLSSGGKGATTGQ